MTRECVGATRSWFQSRFACYRRFCASRLLNSGMRFAIGGADPGGRASFVCLRLLKGVLSLDFKVCRNG
jgi:hypothetical protein